MFPDYGQTGSNPPWTKDEGTKTGPPENLLLSGEGTLLRIQSVNRVFALTLTPKCLKSVSSPDSPQELFVIGHGWPESVFRSFFYYPNATADAAIISADQESGASGEIRTLKHLFLRQAAIPIRPRWHAGAQGRI